MAEQEAGKRAAVVAQIAWIGSRVRWLKLNWPPAVCSSLSSWYDRRNSMPMLKVLRPLLHSQLFTIAMPSLRLMDCSQEPCVPQLVGVCWPSHTMYGWNDAARELAGETILASG